jgi:hypothetical protein
MESKAKSEGWQIYQIILRGQLDPSWSDWLNGFALTTATAADGTCLTLLAGKVADQAALRGILTKLWDLNLELVSLYRISTKHRDADESQ